MGEVVDLKKIVCNYMQCFFWLNLVACLPPSMFTLIAGLFTEQSSNSTPSINQTSRMVRIQRLTRLVKLGRLTRLGRMFRFLSLSPFLRSLRSSHGMRIMSLIVSLLWIVHLVGCGWFLCASLHEEHLDTWLARRTVNHDGLALLDSEPYIQWCHAAYFTLTVFTTVGFGDMSATTSGEIAYVSFTMILGAIINSIIVGEVISIVTSADQDHIKIREHKAQVEAFCEHTDLDNRTRLQMSAWIEQAPSSFDYEENCMLKMLTSGLLPRVLLEQLPFQMFGGQLVRNNFFTLCSLQVRHVPPRFSVLLALKVYQIAFCAGEFVYHYNDHPFNLFLVRSGIFACVAKVGSHGAYHEVPQMSHVLSKETSMITKLRGYLMPGSIDPNETQQAYNAALNASLYPYRLLGMMSFFGDAELITGKARQTTVRCESANGGLVLGLHKGDYFDLMVEYPHFARAWRAAALRHDRQDRKGLSTIHHKHWPQNHRVLAGDVLIKFLRRFRENRGLRTPKEGSTASRPPKPLNGPGDKFATVVEDLCKASIKPMETSSNGRSLARHFKSDPTVRKMADVQDHMQNRMVDMQDQITGLQGSMDGMHSLLQDIRANLKSKDVRLL